MLFFGVTFLAMLLSLYAIFKYAPIEKTMGVVQKIFYLHLYPFWPFSLSLWQASFTSTTKKIVGIFWPTVRMNWGLFFARWCSSLDPYGRDPYGTFGGPGILD